jgi:hypothetical protein
MDDENHANKPELNEKVFIELIKLIKLIEELTEGLNRIERRTWWRIFIEGRSIQQTAEIEGVSRQAIYSRLEGMARHNAYVAIAFNEGRLRHRVNQWEYTARHACRRRTSIITRPDDAEITSWEAEGGALRNGPHVR